MTYTLDILPASRNGKPKARPPNVGNDHQPDPRPRPVAATLPDELAAVGEATAQFHEFLAGKGLPGWTVYCWNASEMGDLDLHLAELGEGDAGWEPHPAALNGGAQPVSLDRDAITDAPVCEPAGFLWLRRHGVVVARWVLLDLRDKDWLPIYLYAAARPEDVVALRAAVADVRRRKGQGKWQVYNGRGWRDAEQPRRADGSWDGLVLDPAVRARLEAEVVNFFREPVARMYRDLDIPYRRGVLLFGPPGNGKTSLIRVIGGLNPQVPGLLLRAGEDFTDGELGGVLDTWTRQAPAMLVIEDLDWLFQSARVSVSTFLNLLDGVDRRDGGLLLLATTNHPETLDPAINNRPGRFDVAIEVGNPDRTLRLEFFRRSKLNINDAAVLEKLAATTDGLSFSHLREIESLSGLHALQEGRSARTDRDLIRAAETVAKGYEQARRGFPEPATPFGLSAARRHGG